MKSLNLILLSLLFSPAVFAQTQNKSDVAEVCTAVNRSDLTDSIVFNIGDKKNEKGIHMLITNLYGTELSTTLDKSGLDNFIELKLIQNTFKSADGAYSMYIDTHNKILITHGMNGSIYDLLCKIK